MSQILSISKATSKRRFSIPKPKKSKFYYSEIENKKTYRISDLFTLKKNVMQITFISSQIIAVLSSDGMITLFNIVSRKMLSSLKVHNYAFPGRLHFSKACGNLYSIANEHMVILKIGRNYNLKKIANSSIFKPFITEFQTLEATGHVLLSSYGKSTLEIWSKTCLKKKGQLENQGKSLQFLCYLPSFKMIVTKSGTDLIMYTELDYSIVQKIELKVDNLISFHETSCKKTFISHHKRGKASAVVLWDYQGEFRARSIFETEMDKITANLGSDLVLVQFQERLRILSLMKKSMQECISDSNFGHSTIVSQSPDQEKILISCKNKILSFFC